MKKNPRDLVYLVRGRAGSKRAAAKRVRQRVTSKKRAVKTVRRVSLSRYTLQAKSPTGWINYGVFDSLPVVTSVAKAIRDKLNRPVRVLDNRA